MNYYERHLGDYAKGTAHLTMLEHGAYTLLLDRYYSTEKGIPAAQAHRVARARSREEKIAVDTVLAEFFVLSAGTWTKRRVDEEITKAQARIKAAQENGLKGGRPRKSAGITDTEPNGLSVGSENETQAKAHHTPDSTHQTPDLKPGVKHTELETLRAKDDPPENARGPSTEAGHCCKAMMKQGVQGGNPTHPTLLALIEAGATETEFANAARDAVARGHHNFAYVIGIVKRRREDAAKLVLHQGGLQNKQDAALAASMAATAGWMPPELREKGHAH